MHLYQGQLTTLDVMPRSPQHQIRRTAKNSIAKFLFGHSVKGVIEVIFGGKGEGMGMDSVHWIHYTYIAVELGGRVVVYQYQGLTGPPLEKKNDNFFYLLFTYLGQ